MIPFIALKSLSLGPLTIQVWGLMVALGILAGAWVGAREARKRGLDGNVVWDAAAWVTVGAMVVARLFHVAFYDPATYLADPAQIIAVWKGGMSMFGGLVGATIVGIGYFKIKKFPVLAYIDAMMSGLPLGIGIGRIGCFLIHDHPGTLTHFVLGVKYPDGSVRHDLGLYESIYGFALAIVFYAMSRKNVRPATYSVVFLATYGIFRFITDFLRIVDARYLGLTPAQYLSVAMIFGAWLLWRKKLSARK
ncbi:prolipoprotein diacylglyceryl transferase [bacterium]|nr:prolipoprotein diacylglyceryl transferase [bacterium]